MDTVLERPRWRFTLDYRFSKRFIYGLEYNPAANELNPIRATWDLNPEKKSSPFVSLGTSSDRIGSRKSTRAYYLTCAKSLPHTALAPYMSINYSEQDRGFNFPFGANYQLDRHWGLLPMYDGHGSHLMLNYQQKDYWISAGWIWLRRAGISVGYGF